MTNKARDPAPRARRTPASSAAEWPVVARLATIATAVGGWATCADARPSARELSVPSGNWIARRQNGRSAVNKPTQRHQHQAGYREKCQ